MSTGADAAANDATAEVGGDADQHAYRKQLADDADRAVAKIQGQIDGLKEALKQRKAEARELRRGGDE